MPQGNRTGPVGQGPGSGRALGFCSGYDSPGYQKGFGGGMGRGFNKGKGRGRGLGFGRGHNFGNNFADTPQMKSLTKEDEIRNLKLQIEALERSRKNVERRLNELEKEKE
jgi:hypothetical protein